MITLSGYSASPHAGLGIIMATDDEKAQHVRDYRYSRVIKCSALVASLVGKECGNIP
jgi:hypothetical protein